MLVTPLVHSFQRSAASPERSTKTQRDSSCEHPEARSIATQAVDEVVCTVVWGPGLSWSILAYGRLCWTAVVVVVVVVEGGVGISLCLM